ncbi:MAG: rhodanese-like domain-containing protein [Paludibacter sp.]|nr:rhodanese-like domain-containing protein [Paludibacter sp.]
MKSLKTLLIICLFLPIMVSCQPKENNIKALSSQEFQKTISSRDVFLIDVRTAGEFNNGHIKGAINIDVNNPEFVSLVKSKLNKRSLALYCRSGSRSKVAASKLTETGVIIYELNNGFIDWMQSGLPIEN